MVQTFGDRANFHPHVHALVTRGGWTGSGEWVPAPYVRERAVEELFRHKVLGLLRRLVRYMMRSPVSPTRLRFTPGAKEVVYARKGGHDASEPGEEESVALLSSQG